MSSGAITSETSNLTSHARRPNVIIKSMSLSNQQRNDEWTDYCTTKLFLRILRSIFAVCFCNFCKTVNRKSLILKSGEKQKELIAMLIKVKVCKTQLISKMNDNDFEY